MFGLAARDAHPPPQLEPWSGGYAGIHLAAAAAVFSVQPDAALKNSADSAVQQLLSHRLPHGYIGPWPSKFEVETPRLPQSVCAATVFRF